MKNKTIYKCRECHTNVSKWTGQCPHCQSWNSLTLEEEHVSSRFSEIKLKKSTLSSLVSVNKKDERIKTGFENLDLVFGGGVKKGGLYLLSGSPGSGKSTLISQLIKNMSHSKENNKVLFINNEESIYQSKERFERLKCDHQSIEISSESNWLSIKHEIETNSPSMLIIDSINGMVIQDSNEFLPKNKNQIVSIIQDLNKIIKEYGITTFLIGQIVKDGTLSGPKIIEHIVDVVGRLEVTAIEKKRIFSLSKNRYGSINEKANFIITRKGLEVETEDNQLNEIRDFNPMPGKVLTIEEDGEFFLPFEVHTLIKKHDFGSAQKIINGLSLTRLQTILAVIEKHFRIDLNNYSIVIDTKDNDNPLTKEHDLPIIMSIMSSYLGVRLDQLFYGNVSLMGDINVTKKINIKKIKNILSSDKMIFGVYKNQNIQELSLIHHLEQVNKFLKIETSAKYNWQVNG
jgi:DNA repair protein RadA/Sms